METIVCKTWYKKTSTEVLNKENIVYWNCDNTEYRESTSQESEKEGEICFIYEIASEWEYNYRNQRPQNWLREDFNWSFEQRKKMYMYIQTG